MRTFFKKYLSVMGIGFAMGSANVIPGVSGGTIAFITGIYDELISSIRCCVSRELWMAVLKFDLKKAFGILPWRFLLSLGIGIVISFATMAKLFVWLLENHPKITNAFFFGLIAASVITMVKKVDKWCVPVIVSGVMGAIAAYGVITLVPMTTPDNWWMMFCCGFICIIAMILPGLSGSFLMLVLGQYERIWQAVADFCTLKATVNQLSALFWVALGGVVGLGSFIHLLNYLMRRFKDATTTALIGFMIGTLPRIWPYIEETGFVPKKGKMVATGFKCLAPEMNITLLYVIIAAVVGTGMVFAVEKLAAGGSEEK